MESVMSDVQICKLARRGTVISPRLACEHPDERRIAIQGQLEASRKDFQQKLDADRFWQELFNGLKDTGELTADAVRAELQDYHMILENVGEVYMHVTGGRISKPNTCARDVIAVADDAANEEWTKYLAEETKGLVEERDEAVRGVNRMKPVVETIVDFYRVCDTPAKTELLHKLAVDVCSAIEEYIRTNSAIAQNTDTSGESAE
jgi:hypothetical protein